MKTEYKNRFIEDNYNSAQRIYEDALCGFCRVWDYVAVTASSESQAEGYREQIEYRLRHGLLPQSTEYIVVPDPDGKRVGSGGACLNVLREIAKRQSDKDSNGKRLFEGKRILCIHSGGDSKRVPQYSVGGKLFAPMPRRMKNGLPSTLFDEIMLTVSVFPSKMRDGMLTCSGDVLLLFDPQETEYFSGGAAAVAIKADASVGCAHGVYLGDGRGRVRRFLHKQPADTLRSCGAVDGDGKVDIDTGAVLFDSEILHRLYSLVDTEEKLRAAVNDRVRLSFYADFSYPLSAEATLGEYLCEKPEGVFTPELEGYRGKIWKLLSDINMRLTVFSPAEFLHFGTTAELRALMTEELPSYFSEGWDRLVNAGGGVLYGGENNIAVNSSVISKDAVIRRGSYIEDSYIGAADIGKGCVISRSVIPDGVTVPGDTVISTVETVDGFVARIYGVFDDPKEGLHFGKKISEPLWSARLFPIRTTPAEAVTASLSVCFGGGAVENERLASLESSFKSAVNDSPMLHREKILEENTKRAFCYASEGKLSDFDAEGLLRGLDSDTATRLIAVLADMAKELEEQAGCEFERNMRMNAYLYALTHRSGYLDAACEYLKKNIVRFNGTELYGLSPVCREKSVSFPVRVNFGGGWTDTPPFCMERGGCVLNAAVILGDSLPITARVRFIPERKLVFISEESGERTEIFADTPASLSEKCRPIEPFAIHKAALLTCGLLRDGGDGRTLFDMLGGGLETYTSVRDIPKGSGLGTSSILSGALISALYGLFGVEAEDSLIWNKVLVMEQYMGTGGGWQDQMGGMTSGIKLISSEPGIRQNPCVTPVKMTEETVSELESRFALIYTGQRREAKHLLREIVWRYIAGHGDTVSTLCRMGELPRVMREHLEKGDIDGFAYRLTEAYEYTEKLYRGCFNLCTDEIFRTVDGLICGKMICGAGGGGFLQVILKKDCSFEALQSRLEAVFGDCEIRAYKCRFIRDLPH